jgi:hypothetical protein
MPSINFRVMSRVWGSIAATRWGVKACCMRVRTRVCFRVCGQWSRARYAILAECLRVLAVVTLAPLNEAPS